VDTCAQRSPPPKAAASASLSIHSRATLNTRQLLMCKLLVVAVERRRGRKGLAWQLQLPACTR